MTVLDPLRNPIEAFGRLDEVKYKAELDLVDRYQAFVAELLRLSLAGIGVFGFLYQDIFSGLKITCLTAAASGLAALGVVLLGLCAANALVFRFFATEGARYYIEALRFAPAQEALPFAPDQLARARRSLDIRYRRIIVCRWSKGLAAFFLGLGSVLIAIAFCLLVVSSAQRCGTA